MRTLCQLSIGAVLLICAPMSYAKMTVAEAEAVFQRIYDKPAKLKLFCEQVKLQGQSRGALSKNDRTTSDKIQKRINQIHAAIPLYGAEVLFLGTHPKVNGVRYQETPEGKTVDAAQHKMIGGCNTLKP